MIFAAFFKHTHSQSKCDSIICLTPVSTLNCVFSYSVQMRLVSGNGIFSPLLFPWIFPTTTLMTRSVFYISILAFILWKRIKHSKNVKKKTFKGCNIRILFLFFILFWKELNSKAHTKQLEDKRMKVDKM